MNDKTFKILHGLVVFLLVGVCLLQWRHEHKLNQQIEKMNGMLKHENERFLATEEKLRLTTKELELSQSIRLDLEKKITEQLSEIKLLLEDQMGRGFAIQHYVAEELKRQAQQDGQKDWQQEAVEKFKLQNEAIKKQNELIRALQKQRDEAIAKYNQQTKEYNELAEKWNKTQR
jgi:hypothetical protein